MFYCNKCGEKKDWPIDALFRSTGTCEICGKFADCNDITSKDLPVPKIKLGNGIQDVQLGGDNDK